MNSRFLKVVGLIVLLILATGALVFHPKRPLYMQHRDLEVTVDDGTTLRGTVTIPRWSQKPVPGLVLVHGSGPLTRAHVLGDTRRLVRLGFAVLAYDKRGAGESSGEYLRGGGDAAEGLLRRLAADAAAMFDELAKNPEIDSTRVGFFGASQAGWVIPLAAERTRIRPRFNVILAGNAVSTGVEQYYSDLTSDGTGEPQVSDPAEIERRVLGFDGPPGFDPRPVLVASSTPTVWLFGDLDQSGPTFASVLVLDDIRAGGNDRHRIIRYPNANHALRDVDTGESAPIWDDMMHWLSDIGIVEE
jgi:dienelactone hydrolase